MVLPPQYEEMRRARVERTPRAFDEVLANENATCSYELGAVGPEPRPHGWTGPVARPSFEVRRSGASKSVVARIHPDGSTELLDGAFGPLLEKMLVLIDRAGQKAHDEYLAGYAKLRDKD